jgi:RNA-binding protein
MADIPSHVLRDATSKEFKPSVRVGKGGLSETLVDEIRQQLGSRSLVKIKVNKGLFEREQRSEVWQYLAEQTNSILVLQRGNIGVLWRR